VTPEDVDRFDARVAAGGVGLFPADTVYGLAADPESAAAVDRLYRLKGRPPERPAAVMFFSVDRALSAMPDLPAATRDAVERLLPGGLTLVLPNPSRRFLLACGPVPERLGVRVPRLIGELEPLAAARGPILQSSANRTGGPDARRLEEVDPQIRADVDVELDGGELPGTPSTVVDLTRFADGDGYEVVREGAVSTAELARLLETR
jgi:L-threonylcarbamoyladenylate synthase